MKCKALGLIALAGMAVAQPGSALAMRHPGALNSDAEFLARAVGISQKVQPWTAVFDKLRANAHDRPDYMPRPVALVVRGAARGGPPENYGTLFNDAAAAYALALDWRLSGDTQRGAAAARILTAWGNTIQGIDGSSDKYLASGLYGYQLAVAAETLRGFSGWREADAQALKGALLRVFAPMNQAFLTNHNGTPVDHYWANWDLANIASLMAIGVFTDRRDLYDQARDYYLHGAGNGSIGHAAWKVYPGGLAQWQESGRDQAHSMLGIGLAGTICEIAWQQGDDLFGADDNRLLAAARYVAKYNLGEDVPYTPYQDSLATQPVISAGGRGQVRPIWALIYGHYVGRQHLDAPEIAAIMRRDGIEGGGGDYGSTSGGFDQLGYGTLTFLDPDTPVE